MKTREFNLCDYTGNTAVVSYSVKNRSFEFNGEKFTIGKFYHVHKGEGYAELYGDNWTGPLTTLHIATSFVAPNELHELVVAATRYAANCV